MVTILQTFSSTVYWGDPQPQEDGLEGEGRPCSVGLEGRAPEGRCAEQTAFCRPREHPGTLGSVWGLSRVGINQATSRNVWRTHLHAKVHPPQNRVVYFFPWSGISPELLGLAIHWKSAEERHLEDRTPTEALCIFPAYSQRGSDANHLSCSNSTSAVQLREPGGLRRRAAVLGRPHSHRPSGLGQGRAEWTEHAHVAPATAVFRLPRIHPLLAVVEG